MLQSLTTYIQDRREGLVRKATYVGGAYLAWRHVAARVKEFRDVQIIQKFSEDSIRRRFQQSQQDVSFTIMALLPTLGRKILDGMDVEAVTSELQAMSKAAKAQAAVLELQTPSAPSDSSASSSVQGPSGSEDARSDNGSVSVISAQDDTAASDLGTSTVSWVENMSVSDQASQQSHSPEASSTSSRELPQESSPESNIGTDLSESFISSSSVSYGDVMAGPHPGPSEPTPTFTRSKAELWKEVKMLTFTRTLTTLYSMTLLSLLTHIQINILGRMIYMVSATKVAEDEREREMMRDGLSLLNLLWGVDHDVNYSKDDIYPIEPVSENTKQKYLTLSWWLLHVGWKDVGERVRRAVEEVFEEISLKSKISASDLHRLLCDVRRRIEHEITFEGTERRINFASTLLPPTPETLRHVLLQGGIPFPDVITPDPVFDALLAETRAHVASGSFELVLHACLDRATDILQAGVERSVFGAGGEWDDPNAPVGPGQEPRVRLAGMLPALARWSQLALEGMPNELVDGLGELREVAAFSAIIYTNYGDRYQE